MSSASLTDLDRLAAALRAEPVVCLGAARRIRNLYQRRRSENAGEAALATIEVLLVDAVQGLHGCLLFWVRRVCDAHPDLEVPALARLVARDPDFQRVSRLIRQTRAVFTEVPSCGVRPHLRDGRLVRAHSRYLGREYLAETPLADQPEGVAAVIRCLVAGAHRRLPQRTVRLKAP